MLDTNTKALLDKFIERSLQEDAPEGDRTSLACIDQKARNKAKLLVKDVGIIAGIEVAKYIFEKIDDTAVFTQHIQDGKEVRFGQVAFEIEATSRGILLGERLVLNTMQRMSGIATLANHFVFETEDLDVKVLDTRKTTPQMRFLEKIAVKIGGCHNYRHSLSDWFMIKDNHIDACGGITQAIKQVEAYQKEHNLDLGVTIEVRNLVELHEVLNVGKVTRIMLDNFELPLLYEAVATVNKRFETEASGGININTVRRVAKTGVDYISVGALTHSVPAFDLSLKIVK
ncbi:MAG: nicotinate-nucleotide pyrophosphorylase (carboxylating) [Paraglaciecola sp.]|jgi:nicotinate-nucleotide pyrophosphorylase (carboxylating)